MILRSGLIKKQDAFSDRAFTEHWTDVHARLTLLIPGLLGYTQNHIVARKNSADEVGLHRVDGISQLWFESYEAMETAMATPQQAECVADISEFLDEVTVIIQQPGEICGDISTRAGAKQWLMLPTGATSTAELTRRMMGLIGDDAFALAYRISEIIEQRDSDHRRTRGEYAHVVELWGMPNSSEADLRAELSWTDALAGETLAYSVNQKVFRG